MKTLLVLAEHPALAESIRTALAGRAFRVIHRTTLNDAEPLLAHSLADACILDAELSSVQSAWAIDKFRQLTPAMPLVVYAATRQWEWEEESLPARRQLRPKQARKSQIAIGFAGAFVARRIFTSAGASTPITPELNRFS